MSWWRGRVPPGGDDGQLLLLVLVYAVIAALLVTVVVDLSKVYLYRRALVAAADGAALSAANEPDLVSVYRGGNRLLPLSDAGAQAAVRQYEADGELDDRFEGFRIDEVVTDGTVVRVRFGAVVHLPFATLLVGRWRGGYPVRATARAESPLGP
ncbi:MAG TPA: pilus assembly protein TadG-related protein [Actinomycetes bacterium]|jgi:hypothetical protein